MNQPRRLPRFPGSTSAGGYPQEQIDARPSDSRASGLENVERDIDGQIIGGIDSVTGKKKHFAADPVASDRPISSAAVALANAPSGGFPASQPRYAAVTAPAASSAPSTNSVVNQALHSLPVVGPMMPKAAAPAPASRPDPFPGASSVQVAQTARPGAIANFPGGPNPYGKIGQSAPAPTVHTVAPGETAYLNGQPVGPGAYGYGKDGKPASQPQFPGQGNGVFVDGRSVTHDAAGNLVSVPATLPGVGPLAPFSIVASVPSLQPPQPRPSPLALPAAAPATASKPFPGSTHDLMLHGNPNPSEEMLRGWMATRPGPAEPTGSSGATASRTNTYPNPKTPMMSLPSWAEGGAPAPKPGSLALPNEPAKPVQPAASSTAQPLGRATFQRTSPVASTASTVGGNSAPPALPNFSPPKASVLAGMVPKAPPPAPTQETDEQRRRRLAGGA